MRLQLVEVLLTSEYGDMALSCHHDGARYHVWLGRHSHAITSKVLFKNSIPGHGEPGYFQTRKLKDTSEFAQKLIGAMLTEANKLGMFEAAELKLKVQKAADEQVRKTRQHEKRVTDAAPEMYALLLDFATATPEWQSRRAELLDKLKEEVNATGR